MICYHYRTTPTYALIVAFNATWLRHMGHGPYWSHYIGRESEYCRRKWWANVLYIDNFIDLDHTVKILFIVTLCWHIYFLVFDSSLVSTVKYAILCIITVADIIDKKLPKELLVPVDELPDINHVISILWKLCTWLSHAGSSISWVSYFQSNNNTVKWDNKVLLIVKMNSQSSWCKVIRCKVLIN